MGIMLLLMLMLMLILFHPLHLLLIVFNLSVGSVCLVLEVCSFGSLSDIIRGYGFDWNTSQRPPLHLGRTDLLYLALGCARGLAAVHSYSSSICHRDVKSFNFLGTAHRLRLLL